MKSIHFAAELGVKSTENGVNLGGKNLIGLPNHETEPLNHFSSVSTRMYW